MLGLVVILSYQVAIGNVYVQVGDYRGEYNSAWVGSMMAIVASVFLGWFGFYLVKGSVTRDRATGVGQIMATTPLSRLQYVLGKWIGNFAVLAAMVIILIVVAVGIQVFAGESKQLELVPLLAPFIFIALPVLALTAAVAVLFETIGFLSSGLGNVIYFFLFIMVLPLGDTIRKTEPALEPTGAGLLQQSMGAAAKASFPDYDGGFMLGSTDTPVSGVFHWSGVEWTYGIILERLSFFGIAIVLIMLASFFFDRFDPSRRKPRRRQGATPAPEPQVAFTSHALSQTVHFTPLSQSPNGFAFISVLNSELKLLLKGQRWWWYAVAIGLLIASLVSPLESVRTIVLPFAWIWPILIWSGMGQP